MTLDTFCACDVTQTRNLNVSPQRFSPGMSEDRLSGAVSYSIADTRLGGKGLVNSWQV